MLKLMQKKALQLYVEAEKAGDSELVEKSPLDGNSVSPVDIDGGNGRVKPSEMASDSIKESDNGRVLGGRGMKIKCILGKELRPVELEVENISYQHAGHAGVKGSGDGETHFNVKVVSEEFEGKSLLKRHRLIYGLLQEELQSGLHALSIEAKTPAEVGTP